MRGRRGIFGCNVYRARYPTCFLNSSSNFYNFLSQGVSLLFHFHPQRYFDMSAASLLTSSALAGRAAPTQRAVAARGDGANGVGGLRACSPP